MRTTKWQTDLLVFALLSLFHVYILYGEDFIYVTMTEKMGPDEEKSDFEFLAFFVLYYINKACVKILWQFRVVDIEFFIIKWLK